MKTERYIDPYTEFTEQLHHLASRYVECLVVVLFPLVLLTEQKAVSYVELGEEEDKS